MSRSTGNCSLDPGQGNHRDEEVDRKVTGDVLREASETFSVTLSDPTNATIADAKGLGTILDND
jgi:large repetitive protein